MNLKRYYINNFSVNPVYAIGSGDTSITLPSSVFSTSVPIGYYVAFTLADGSGNTEIVYAFNQSGGLGSPQVFNVVRGQEGTTAQAWGTTATVAVYVTASSLVQAQAYDFLVGSNNVTYTSPVWLSTNAYVARYGDGKPDALSTGTGAYALCIRSGTSGALAPTWPVLTSGQSAIVADGTVRWAVYPGDPTGSYQNTLDWDAVFNSARSLSGLSITNGFAPDRGYIFGDSLAIGCAVSAPFSSGIGMYTDGTDIPQIRVTEVHHIQGPSLLPSSNYYGTSKLHVTHSGQENIIMSQEFDCKVGSTTPVSITLPLNTRFFVNEVGVIITSLVGTIGTKPTLSFGVSGSDASLLAATLTTMTAAVGGRNRYTTLLNNDGVTSLTARVTTAASGGSLTTLLARVYFKGMLVENESA